MDDTSRDSLRLYAAAVLGRRLLKGLRLELSSICRRR